VSVEQYNAQLKNIETKINDKKVFGLMYVIIPVIILLSLYGYYKTLTMTYPVVTAYDIRFFPLGGIVFFAAAVFLVYLVIPVLYKMARLISLPQMLHREFSIRVRPLHPDTCGGLKSLGDLYIRFDYILLIGAVGSIVQMFFSEGEEFGVYLYFFLIYAFLVTFAFLYPLWPIHTVMKAQKYDLLNNLNENLDPVYQEIKDNADISIPLEKIEKMDLIYERVRKMPVWPFDTGGLIKVCTTVCIPLFSILADVFIF
jgi:hypothetical protein